MSSEKIYTTVGIDRAVMNRLNMEMAAEDRSRSFMLERILRERYQMPRERETEEIKNADKA